MSIERVCSTIVNLKRLDGTRRDEASRLFVRIQGGRPGNLTELPVSRAYVHLFKAIKGIART